MRSLKTNFVWQAVLNAWGAACSSNAASPILVIPSQRTFLLYPTMAFNGPCKSPKIGIAVCQIGFNSFHFFFQACHYRFVFRFLVQCVHRFLLLFILCYCFFEQHNLSNNIIFITDPNYFHVEKRSWGLYLHLHHLHGMVIPLTIG